MKFAGRHICQPGATRFRTAYIGNSVVILVHLVEKVTPYFAEGSQSPPLLAPPAAYLRWCCLIDCDRINSPYQFELRPPGPAAAGFLIRSDRGLLESLSAIQQPRESDLDRALTTSDRMPLALRVEIDLWSDRLWN